MTTKDQHLDSAKRAQAKNFEYLHILRKGEEFIVKGYDEWPSYSVLAGQTRISYVDTFEVNELELAKEIYPEATLSHDLMEPVNTFDHLSDSPDSW